MRVFFTRSSYIPREMRTDPAVEELTALLLRLLSEENRYRYMRGAEIMITGSAGGKYGITHSLINNIRKFEPTGYVSTYCSYASVNGHYPPSTAQRTIDVLASMITQIATIITNEAAFLRMANLTSGAYYEAGWSPLP